MGRLGLTHGINQGVVIKGNCLEIRVMVRDIIIMSQYMQVDPLRVTIGEISRGKMPNPLYRKVDLEVDGAPNLEGKFFTLNSYESVLHLSDDIKIGVDPYPINIAIKRGFVSMWYDAPPEYDIIRTELLDKED